MAVNTQLADELHEPIIKEFKEGNVYERFKENTSIADYVHSLLIIKIKIFAICHRCFHYNMHGLKTLKRYKKIEQLFIFLSE